MIEIIEYHDKYASDFKDLNMEWLTKYNLAESHDLEVLNDPRGTILNTGGKIFLAKEGEEIVGTAAIAKSSAGSGQFELAKMSVAPTHRGKGIAKILLQHCLDAAKELNANRIILFSNHQLVAALEMYKKFGFKDISVDDSPFETADVKMELVL
ncbi:MAG: GNAT family N-acetyltransferase [Chitinophagaceae bacterium]